MKITVEALDYLLDNPPEEIRGEYVGVMSPKYVTATHAVFENYAITNGIPIIQSIDELVAN